MPKLMVKTLVEQSQAKLNYFPVKGGISAYYSPHDIIVGRKLNYEKHFAHGFGAYVQAHDDPVSYTHLTLPTTSRV